jgi:regulatory protein
MGHGAGARAARNRSPLSLKGRALALLAQREHSVSELRRKLLRHVRAQQAAAAQDGTAGDPAAVEAGTDDADADDSLAQVDAVIDWLRANRYLSEERFIESRVHARAGRYGNLRIRQELAQHGLDLPAPAAQALKETELERARDVWRRKFGAAPADAADRARQSRFLAQRGFSPEVIFHLLREVKDS